MTISYNSYSLSFSFEIVVSNYSRIYVLVDALDFDNGHSIVDIVIVHVFAFGFAWARKNGVTL